MIVNETAAAFPRAFALDIGGPINLASGNYYASGGSDIMDVSGTSLRFNQAQFANVIISGAGVGNVGIGYTAPTTALDVNGTVGIGTSSPYAKLSIHANNLETKTVLFAIGSSTATATTTLFGITNTGHPFFGGTGPIALSGAASVAGSDAVGSTTAATGATSIVYIQFGNVWKTSPNCMVNLQPSILVGTTTVIYAVATTTGQLAIVASSAQLGGSIIQWHCFSN